MYSMTRDARVSPLSAPSSGSGNPGCIAPPSQIVSRTSVALQCDEQDSTCSSTPDSNCFSTSSADDAEVDQSHVISTLTSPMMAHSRRNRLPASVQQQQTLPPSFEIPSQHNNYTYSINQDVRPLHLDAAPTAPSSSISRQNGLLSRPFESPQLSSFSPTPYKDAITQSSPRLRTVHSVYHTVSDLASQYGIPQRLPPVPRTTPRNQPDNLESSSEYSPFPNLISNYLAMLSDTSEDNNVAAEEPVSQDSAPAPEVQAILDVIKASPEFTSSPDFNASPQYTVSPDFNEMYDDFLTSPMDDSPLDDFLSTPVMADIDDMNHPGVYDSGMSGSLFDDLPLFADGALGYDESFHFPKPSSDPAPVHSSVLPGLDGLISMSPSTPSLDPASLFASPRLPSQKALPVLSSESDTATSTRPKSVPTGTRKNITPASLIPVEAPTQKRTYYTPSATSRKDVPVVFARKRARSQAFGNEEDQLQDDGSHLTMTEQEAIEAKRRQNTIAARRSRKRKLEYQKELEDAYDAEKRQKEMWKSRALTMHSMLVSHGIQTPALDDL